MPNISGSTSTAAASNATDGTLKDVPLTASGALRVFDEGGGGAPAAGADGVTNPTLDSHFALVSGFNGTTWDRLRTAITTVSATLTGFLTTLPWALYHSSPVTRTNGQGGPIETDASGNLRTSEQNVVGWNNLNMTTATTTTAKSGAGVLHTIVVGTNVASATIKIYDNTAGSGTSLGVITLGSGLTVDPNFYLFDVVFNTGLTIVTSGATDITVTYL